MDENSEKTKVIFSPVEVKTYGDMLRDTFAKFQENMEAKGVGDLFFDAGRALQSVHRYMNELARDKSEHDLKLLSDARTAATWSMEIMRALPILAPYKPELPEVQREIRARINAEFSIYFACGWMDIEDPNSCLSERTFDLLLDALQFRSGCRHTLAVAYSMMVDCSK